MNAKDWKKYLEIDPELLPIWKKYQVDFERLLNPVIAEIERRKAPLQRIHFYPHKVVYEDYNPENNLYRTYLDFDIYISDSRHKYKGLLDYGKFINNKWCESLNSSKRDELIFTRVFVVFPDTDQDLHEMRKERYGRLIDGPDGVEFQRKLRAEWDDRERRLWGRLLNE